MPIDAKRKTYLPKHNFAIEIDGLEIAWFTKCGAVNAKVAVIDHFEGGKNVVAHQGKGRVKWEPVKLEVGVTQNRELYEWFKLVVDSEADEGAIDDEDKKNLAIVTKKADQSEAYRWNLFDAFPFEHDSGDWDATADENQMESVTLTYRYAVRVDP